MDLGAFILGILFGWLIEWLYVSFFDSSSKGKGLGVENCAAFERELKTRNEEIKALKSQIGGGIKGGTSLLSKQAASAISESSKPQAKKTKSGSKSSATATAKNKTTAKNAKTTKATKKVASPRSVAGTKKPAAKKISLKKNIKLNNPTGDDLTKLSGIGPSMAATMAELGITTYKKLAGMDDDILRDMLEASGVRLNNNKDAMDSWNEQAALADKGDFTGLKKLQESLKG